MKEAFRLAKVVPLKSVGVGGPLGVATTKRTNTRQTTSGVGLSSGQRWTL